MFLKRVGQLIIIAALWTPFAIGFQDFDIKKFTLNKFSDVPAMGSLKMFRTDTREYRFNATFNVTTHDPSIYDVEANVFRSAIGNNHFIASPFKIPRKSLCDCLNNEFRDRAMDDVAKHSNLPCEHDKKINLCDLLKFGDHYEVVNYIGDVSKLPKYVANGVYKFVGSLIDRNTNAVVLSVEAITDLY